MRARAFKGGVSTVPLTDKEQAMHLEVKALLELKPSDPESVYIWAAALNMFFDRHAKEILSILDTHFKQKSKG